MSDSQRESAIPEIIAEFSQVFAAAKSRWARYAEEVHPELRGPGMMILQTILRRGPITATGLGSMLDMDKAMVSRQVAKLRGLGLETVGLDPEAGRIATDDRMRAGDRLWHVHLGDSNRLPPGQGHLDFAEVVQALRTAEYSGYLSAELLPLPDPDQAAAVTIEFMRPLTRLSG